MLLSAHFRARHGAAAVLATTLLLICPAAFARQAARDSASLAGVVLDPDARPVAGAQVRLETPAGIHRALVTDASGRFDAHDLSPGAYVLRAAHPGLQAAAQPLRLGPGERREVTIVFELAAVTDTVVVSAAQVETMASATPSPVSVFSARDLDARQIDTASGALRLVPGLSVAQSGTRGSLTSVFPRGGESDYTMVLVDGIRVNAFGGGFDFASLPAGEIERLEVVRGPQSALFGSDAIGSVVQVVTRREGPSRLAGLFEGGSLASARGTATAAVSAGRWTGSASAERAVTDGFTGIAPGTGEPVTNDDHDASSGTASLRYASDSVTVSGVARVASTEKGFPGPYGSDPNGTYGGVDRVSRGWNDDRTYGFGAAVTFSPAVRLHAQASHASLDGRFRSAFGTSFSETRRTSGRLQVDGAIGPAVGVSVGTEVLDEEARSTYVTDATAEPLPVTRRNAGVFGEARVELPGRLSAAAGVRLEHLRRDALAGNEGGFPPRPPFAADTVVSVNPRVAASWFVRAPASGAWSWTRLRASAGTGIRAPDAFEIAFTDNPTLEPERSESVDAGLEQALFDGRVVAEATVFHNRYDQLIIAVGRAFEDASRYRTDNIANARASGVEVLATARPRGGIELRAGYTFLDTEVLAVDGGSGAAPPPFEPGDPLIRRPRHQGWAEVLASGARWSAFARVGARGRVLDVDPSFGAFGGKVEAPGFATTDVGASMTLWREVGVFGRISNLFDRAYEEAFGFPSPGRTVTAGVRVAASR